MVMIIQRIPRHPFIIFASRMKSFITVVLCTLLLGSLLFLTAAVVVQAESPTASSTASSSTSRRSTNSNWMSMNHPPPSAVSSSPFQTTRGGTSSSDNDGNKLVEVIEVDEDHDGNISIYEKEAKNLFHVVVTVATINMLINTFRPDDAIAWPLRLPRILWELSLAVVAKSAASKRNSKRTEDKRQSSHSSPSILLLLATMLITTGITDIFVWAPLFSAFVQFKTCTGGFFTGEPYKCSADHIKGYGRVVVVVQSLMGGLLYLLSGIAAYNAYSDVSYQHKLNRQVTVMEHMNRVEREQRQLLIKQQQKQQEGQQQQHDAFDNLWKLFFNTA